MPVARTQLPLRTLVFLALAWLSLALSGSCGGDGGKNAEPTKPAPTGTVAGPATTAAEVATPTDGRSPFSPSESGEAPVFWRTEDGFESLRAGEPYKVLLRITNGYAEDTLVTTASCVTCAQEAVERFEASRVEPEGEEDSGSFYPFNLELPQPGRWELTVMAGDDEARTTVEALPPD